MLVSRRGLRRHGRGFTLIELVTAITVMAVLAGLALPSFRSFVINQRLRNASFDLMAALTLVRSEAVTRGNDVSIKKTGADWDQGWKVFDTLSPSISIKVQDAYKNIAITAGPDTITFGKDGRVVPPSTAKFTIAPPSETTGVSIRCITIGLNGVPKSPPPEAC